MNIENIIIFLGRQLKAVSMIGILVYGIGVLIWNFYLNELGFQELAIIEVRFIASGLLFLLFLIFLAGILQMIKDFIVWTGTKLPKFITKAVSKIMDPFSGNMNFRIFIITFLVVTIFIQYVRLIFPRVPQAFGGGQPRVLSLIGTSEEIQYLTTFGIRMGSGSKIQTENLCFAYENNDLVVLILENRILGIKKTEMKGYGSLPGLDRKYARKACSDRAINIMTNETLMRWAIPQ